MRAKEKELDCGKKLRRFGASLYYEENKEKQNETKQNKTKSKIKQGNTKQNKAK